MFLLIKVGDLSHHLGALTQVILIILEFYQPYYHKKYCDIKQLRYALIENIFRLLAPKLLY